MAMATEEEIKQYHEAAKRGTVAAVQAFVATYPDLVDIPNENDSRLSAIHYASKRELTEMVRVLLDAGADPDLRTPKNSSPLLMAAIENPPAAKLIFEALKLKYANRPAALYHALNLKTPDTSNSDVIGLLSLYDIPIHLQIQKNRDAIALKTSIIVASNKCGEIRDDIVTEARVGNLGKIFNVEEWAGRREEMDDRWKFVPPAYQEQVDIEAIRGALSRQERLARRIITGTPHL
jgi:hypothetical protein